MYSQDACPEEVVLKLGTSIRDLFKQSFDYHMIFPMKTE